MKLAEKWKGDCHILLNAKKESWENEKWNEQHAPHRYSHTTLHHPNDIFNINHSLNVIKHP